MEATPGAKFVHICSNETIGGVEFKDVPDTGDVPLVADMSSNYLSKPIDVKKYGIIYGGVQKNIGPAGMAIVIVRDDLSAPSTPRARRCSTISSADNDSMYNTPCYTMYALLVFKKLPRWAASRRWRRCHREGEDAVRRHRRLGRVLRLACGRKVPLAHERAVHALRRRGLEKKFLTEPNAAGLESLKGHRSVGGARASIYNAMPMEGVQALGTQRSSRRTTRAATSPKKRSVAGDGGDL